MEHKNFRKLLEEYRVEIPIIQRDYAHGRNEKTKRIVKKLIEDITKKLENGGSLHLDFIYGKLEEESKTFVPIDGQQRLTLLFLLHLYLGKRENQGVDLSFLKNFSYAVRVSSREFCEMLVDKFKLPDGEGKKVSHYLKNKSWFMPQWEKDPTIRSMLEVLDIVHEKLKNTSVFFNDLEKITFKVFLLEKFGLDEELYIRMNSQGRQLTDFEIFKAQFEEFLKSKGFEGELEEFSQKVDNEWTDFFWKHYKEKYEIDGETYYAIDAPFVNFFYYLAEMVGYETLNPKEDFSERFYKAKELSEEFLFPELFELLFSDSQKVAFLIGTLNNLKTLKELSEKLFGSYSLTEEDYGENKGKVAVADQKVKSNLLDRAVKGSELNLTEKVILYAAILLLKEKETLEEEELKDLIRVVRNLLVRVRALKSGATNHTSNLEKTDLYKVIAFIKELVGREGVYRTLAEAEERSIGPITKNSLSQEIEKARLIVKDAKVKEFIHKIEDHLYIGGDLANLLWSGINFKEVSKRLYETFAKSDEEIIPTLIILSKESYPLKIANNKFFFGREGHWEVLLTLKGFKELWKTYFTHEDYGNGFENLRKEFLEKYSTSNRDWKYYFVKYDKVFEKFEIPHPNPSFEHDRNVFLSPPGREELALCVEKMRTYNANSYHLNPFIYLVAKRLKLNLDYADCSEVGGQKLHYGFGTGEDFHSYIILNGKKFGFRCPEAKGCDGIKDGWVIVCRKEEKKENNEDLVELLIEKIKEELV